MKLKQHQFGSSGEAIIYPVLLLVVMWLVYWADHLFPFVRFYQYGVMPGELSSLKGILFMPLIHDYTGFEHIVNNSFPTAILLGAIIYYYRDIALRVFVVSWLVTGFGVWAFAENTNSYHIGMSGVIYAMAGFLFTSGVLRKYRPLQAISLFVAFLYGSMIWGIFPMEQKISWEGHLSGLIVGVLLAVFYRKQGPQAPKYQYEIEKEMGIEPPDLEGQWLERVEQDRKRREELENRMKEQEEARRNAQAPNPPSDPLHVIYHYKPKDLPSDDTEEE